MEARRARPEQRQPALCAPGPRQDRVDRTGRPGQQPIEHPPREAVERSERWQAGRRRAARRQQDRVEDGGRERQAGIEHRGVGEHVDAVDDDEVVPGEQCAEAAVVVLAVGEVEVTEHGDLVQRWPAGGFGGDRRDPPRIGMRPGHLDPHARQRERGTVERPADGGHLVPALDEPARKEDERRHVTGRADRGKRDPHVRRRRSCAGPSAGRIAAR